MRKGLMAFYEANKGKSQPLAVVRNGNEVAIEVIGPLAAEDDIAEWLGAVSMAALSRELRSLSAGDTVHLRIHSPGGDVFAGVMAAAAIRETKAKVIAHVDGHAASAATLLVAAADEAIIAPGGMVMIHKAWTIALGNADDFMATAGLLEQIDGQLVEAYREKAGDKHDWAALMTAETWFTAAEAVEAGLVDAVAEKADKKPKMAFDLSAYDNAPAAVADDDHVIVTLSLNTETGVVTATPAPDPEFERRRQMARLTLATAA